MKKIIALIMALALTACGSIEQRSVGIEADTLLVIRGELLVGLTVEVEPGFSRRLVASDLTDYKGAVLGAKDRDEEGFQTVTLKIDKGNHQITVSSGNSIMVNQEMYFAEGQTRELRIRK